MYANANDPWNGQNVGRSLVETRGFEPLTPCVQIWYAVSRRVPSRAVGAVCAGSRPGLCRPVPPCAAPCRAAR